MIPKNKAWRYTGNEMSYVKEVLDSGFCAATCGNMNQRLEEAFAKRVGSKYAITMNSGTTTLHAALAAFGVGPGDEVIIPALTVIMCGLAVVYCNAKPVFTDIDPETFLMDPKDVEKKITNRTKAIMPVHLYGQMCDMDAIMTIAKKYNLKVVEDCAECYLASDHKGRLSGTVGDVGSFSMENSKHISVGDGGIVVTNDEAIAERMRKFSGMGFKNIKAANGQVRKNKDVFQNPNYLRHDAIGWNYRLSEITAAVGLAQVERLDEFVNLRKKIGEGFKKVISDTRCDWLIPQKTPADYVNSYWTFVVKYEGKEKKGVEWVDFRNKYLELGGDGIYSAWALVYNEPAMQTISQEGTFFPNFGEQGKQFLGITNNVNCPNAEALQPKLMQFPTNQFGDEEINLKVEALTKAIEFYR
jgi:perosamine synthetase